jgi:hypothetical protein
MLLCTPVLMTHSALRQLLCTSVCCRQEQRKVEYEERQAARKERDGETVKPKKFEMEVSSSSAAAGDDVCMAAAVLQSS